MGLLDRLASALGYAKADAPSPARFMGGGSGSSYVPIAGPRTWPGWDKWNGNDQARDEMRARVAIQSGWVYSALTAIAREFSAADLRVMKRLRNGEFEEDTRHPFAAIWRKPNPYMGSSYSMEYWAELIKLSGNGYYYLATAGNQIKEIWPIPSFTVRPVGDKDTFVSHYEFKPNGDGGTVYRLDPRYVIWSREVNPFDMRDGLSPLVAAYLPIETDLAQSAWNSNYFSKNNATPTAIISVPADLNDSDFLRFKSELFNFFGGTERRTMVARGREIDVKILSTSQKEADFIASRNLNREEIDRIFGIPSGYWAANATEANARHAKAVLIENVVWPLLTKLAEDMNSVLEQWYGDDFYVEFEDIRPRDKALRLNEITSWKSYRTINEIRKEEGLDPLEGELWASVPADVANRVFAPPPDQGPAPAPPTLDLESLLDSGDLTDTETGPTFEADMPNPETEDMSGGVADMTKGSRWSMDATPEDKKRFLESIKKTEKGCWLWQGAKNEKGYGITSWKGNTERAHRVSFMLWKGAIPQGHQILHKCGNTSCCCPDHMESGTNAENVIDRYGPPDERKDADLERWQAKAVKAVKMGKSANVRFESDHIPADEVALIRLMLASVKRADEVRAAFDALKAKAMTPLEQAVYDRIAPVLAQYGDDVLDQILKGDTPDFADLPKDLQAALYPALVEAVTAEMERVAGVDFDPAQAATLAGEWARSYSQELISGLDDTTRKIVQDAVAQFADTPGMTRGDLEKLLQPAFGPKRAEVIAITETTRAASQAMSIRQRELAEAGLDFEKVWRTNNDELVCPICGPLNGKAEDKWNGAHPDGPPAHVRCRCSVTLRMKQE